MRFFWILPVTVRGRSLSATKRNSRGSL
jgi:hypothetical protein